MKVAVVYNRDSQRVINLFGMPNQEKIGLKTIRRLVDALKAGGHQVVSFEADKDLVQTLEDFMPRVVQGERPGMVFNVSYGLQGQARYTHVPSILEMVGIPYVASGPLGHSLALDKVVTKMILRQQGIPTPDFVLLDHPDANIPAGLSYPIIVKPRNEAVSLGLAVVSDEAELREKAGIIFEQYRQAVLAEQYIDGREINVGLLGNSPPEAFPPVMLEFGDGPEIYRYEDKTGKSGRTVGAVCPAPIGRELSEKAQDIAVRSFSALGLADCARVDMRLDKEGNLYVLEANSMPSLGEHGSYLVGAAAVGLDFTQFVNRLVSVASARYFGTPQPPAFDARSVDPSTHVFSYITQRRERLEKRLREWVEVSSRTNDPVGVDHAIQKAATVFDELGMRPVGELTDGPEVATWETTAGMDGGTLLVAHVDSAIDVDMPPQAYRRDPEWLQGEGVGTTRAPLVMVEYAFRALRAIRILRRIPLGVLLYADEGRDATHSAGMISTAGGRVKRVLVLRPAMVGGGLVTNRRGLRRFSLIIEGDPVRPGQVVKKLPVLRWASEKLERMADLSSATERLSVATLDLSTERHATMVPHRVVATMLVTYFDPAAADAAEEKMRAILGKKGPTWKLRRVSDRPPMRERRGNQALARALESVAREWELPVHRASSTIPSVAGLIPARTACICGVAPVCRDRGTPMESVQRISLVQRTLLLAEYLVTLASRT
jgi:D-alanine-D-alanine ligase